MMAVVLLKAEIDDDGLEISRERDTQPADPGKYEVGDAATVRFWVSGNKLKLDALQATSGRNETKRDVGADDIEIDFVNGQAAAEFEVDRSRGPLELEISDKVSGTAP